MARRGAIHPLPVRVAHGVNAFAMVCMLMSGWAIYNASPIFAFSFPAWATVGGWLGGSIAWHFAAMWLLAANGLVYVAYGFASGHFRRVLLPIRRDELMRDMRQALRLELQHRLGVYNTVQRLLYIVVLLLGVLVVASGLSIWKPVQLSWLTDFFGGYDVAREVHFIAMAGIAGFIVIHLLLVLIVPRTILPMISGRATAREAQP
jgi:thiosulfate reductase cytochrome b subunit